MRRLTFFTFLMLAGMIVAGAQQRRSEQRSIERVKTEQTRAKREIRETGKQIDINTQQTEAELRRLEQMRDKAASLQSEINARRGVIDSLSTAARALTDSINARRKRVDKMRDTFVKAMRASQGNRRATDRLTFIFSAESFKQAWRRFRYLGEYGRWQRVKTDMLRAEVVSLDSARRLLDAALTRRKAEEAALAADRAALDRSEQEARQLVAQLKSQGRELRTVLRRKEERARELDRELDRLIAAEQARIERERREAEERQRREAEQRRKREAEQRRQRASDSSTAASSGKPTPAPSEQTKSPSKQSPSKPAITPSENERVLSGNFASNKGRLLFPVGVAYRITRGFGRQRHPDMRNIETDNNGIDITVAAGTSARAIFAGKVASIMQYPGCNNIVIIRHGDYYAVYSNMGQLAVRVGDNVAAGQRIGTIFSDAGSATLHFELRHGSTKLNPTEWLRR